MTRVALGVSLARFVGLKNMAKRHSRMLQTTADVGPVISSGRKKTGRTMMSDLVIRNVDLELLERQRKILAETLMDPEIKRRLDPDDYENLGGLLNMLDDWSDSVQQYENL
jgi:hypothetical protein